MLLMSRGMEWSDIPSAYSVEYEIFINVSSSSSAFQITVTNKMRFWSALMRSFFAFDGAPIKFSLTYQNAISMASLMSVTLF